MNNMLVVLFDNVGAADAGVHALRKLHSAGDITLYAMAMLARDASGRVSCKAASDDGFVGTPDGLAVGAFVGLIAGSAGLAVGAVTGTLTGAIRDFWAAGVDLDFVEEAEKKLQPGKVALVAEVDEEWVVPVNAALEANGGFVFRRTRSEVVDTQFDHHIMAFRGEIEELEAEAANATGVAKSKLQVEVDVAKAGLARAVQHAEQRLAILEREAAGKAKAISEQSADAHGGVKASLEGRVVRMRNAYLARGEKLSLAWGLTKETLAV